MRVYVEIWLFLAVILQSVHADIYGDLELDPDLDPGYLKLKKPLTRGKGDQSLISEDTTISIRYTIRNLRKPPYFLHGLNLRTQKKVFFDIMREAADQDERFQFNGTCSPVYAARFGFYVSEINQLSEDPNEGLFWAFIKRSAASQYRSECLLPKGVSTYIPSDGENIVFSYDHLEIFTRLPECAAQPLCT